MTSKEILIFLVKHGHKLKKEKVDELKNIVLKDLDRLEKLEKKIERIKECIGMATSVTITDSLNSTRNDILAEVREVLKNA